MSAAPNLWHASNGWQKHSGADVCPIAPDTIVRFEFACGQISPDRRAGDFIWKRRGWDFDIKAYKVVSVPQEMRG